MGLFAVIDIGGTSIKYGVINEDGINIHWSVLSNSIWYAQSL